MITPSFDQLLSKVDSKYTLVVATAKRARELMDDHTENAVRKPVTSALEEIAAGFITYQKVKQGVK